MPQSMQHLSSTFPRTLPTTPLMASLPKNGRPTPSPTPQKSPDPHDIGTSQPVILPKPLPRRPSSLEDHHHIHKHYIQLAMIVMACMVGVIMFLCTVSVLIRYLYSRRYGRNPNTGDAPILFDVSGNPPTWGDDDDFDQEDLAVIHPVWYIRTVGLQQSLIDSITVFKYKKDEGIIDGTECSVCLGEFEHDDTLRLLPKCSHAFHIPCIDTWLRSHKNCPLCRAPVLRDGEARAVDHHAQVENSDHETSEDDDDDDDDDEHDGGGPGASSNSSALELEEEKETQSLRRSASVDSSSANSMLLFRDNYGEKVNSCSKHGSVSSTSSSSTRLASIGRALQLQKRPVSTARSFSHNTNFFFSKHRRSQSSTLPL